MSAPAQPTLPLHSDRIVAAMIAQLQQLDIKDQQLEAETKRAQSTERKLEYAELKIQVLEQRLRLERIANYGKRSETLSDLQLELLDLEPDVSSEEIEAESKRIVAPEEDKPESKPRRKHPRRQRLPAHLGRVEQIVACTAGQCTCGQCGRETTVIGHEETEGLDVRPAEYFVAVIKREMRACKRCEEQGVRTAGVPSVSCRNLCSRIG